MKQQSEFVTAAEFLQSPEGKAIVDLIVARVTDKLCQTQFSGVEGAHNRIDELENIVREIAKRIGK